MASYASRQLLRGVSPHATRLPAHGVLIIRSMSARPQKPSLYGPTSPVSPLPNAAARNAADQALLSKLSNLSPEQIKDLLSTQPGNRVPSPPGPPGPTHSFGSPPGSFPAPSNPRRRTKLMLRAAFVFTAMYLGYAFGEMLIDDSPIRWHFSDPDMPPDSSTLPHHITTPPVRTELLLRAMHTESVNLPKFLPESGAFQILVSGALHYRRLTVIKPIFLPLDEISGTFADPFFSTISDAVRVDAPELEGTKRISWPAHMALLNRTDPDGVARRKQHLVAGTLGGTHELGLLHQVMVDPDTDELSMLVQFGLRMCGPIGVIHTGAVATVLDEACGRLAARTLPSNTAVTAKLILSHRGQLEPFDLAHIRLSVMTKEAAAAYETAVRDEVGGQFEPLGEHTTVYHRVPRTGPDVQPDQVQTDRKIWIRAEMMRVGNDEIIAEAKALFIVPKGIELEPLGNEW